MPAPKPALQDRLANQREIEITVTGRKSGHAITNPVWFVVDANNVYLIPVEGSDTQWYKNILKNPSIRIHAKDLDAEFKAVPIDNPDQVANAVSKLREKYGPADVKKYYSKLDVAVLVQSR